MNSNFVKQHIPTAPQKEPQHISTFIPQVSDEIIQKKVKSTMETAERMIMQAQQGKSMNTASKQVDLSVV